MKKRFVSFITLILIMSLLALCAGCSKPAETADSTPETTTDAAPPAEETAPKTSRNAALDTAFAAGESFRLVPAKLPAGDLGDDAAPIGLSPDGKTVLYRTGTKDSGYGLYLVRNGKTIPVIFNAERGIGDPHGKASTFIDKWCRILPGREGLSWSADGRYISLSDLHRAIYESVSPDVSVIDTATGDLYLADSFRDGSKATKDGSFNGVVCISRIDRSGKYLYYLVAVQDAYRFCRCPVEGGTPEILYETARDNRGVFDLDYASILTEAPDGSWLMSCINGNLSSRDRELLRISEVRFAFSGNGWTATVTPTEIPSKLWTADLYLMSPVSGYGIMLLRNPNSGAANITEGIISEAAAISTMSWSALQSRINLMRILPGDDAAHDLWWMQKTGENRDAMEMAPGDPFLWSFKLKYGIIANDELALSLKWVGDLDENLFPKGFSPEEALRKDDLNYITCACLSPDGYYALVYTGGRDRSAYLISLEDMRIRAVEITDEFDGSGLTIPAASGKYAPQMTWNADGTLLILDYSAGRARAFRLESGPAAN